MVVDIPFGIGLFELGVFERELSEVLKVKVDLVPSDGLRNRVRDEVEAEAIPL
jgi:predicted nucleotidyltransferase